MIEPRLQTEYVVKEGSTLRVLCEATGVPAPQIDWRRPATNHSLMDDPLLADLVRHVYGSIALSIPVSQWLNLSQVSVSERQRVTQNTTVQLLFPRFLWRSLRESF